MTIKQGKGLASYVKTSVSVGSTQAHIRELLQKYGAKGLQISDEFECPSIKFRFINTIHTTKEPLDVVVRMEIQKGENEKQTWRAIYWWLKSQLEAVEFGLVKFEDVFLSHFEVPVGGQLKTVGEAMLPRFGAALQGNLGLEAGEDDEGAE